VTTIFPDPLTNVFDKPLDTFPKTISTPLFVNDEEVSVRLPKIINVSPALMEMLESVALMLSVDWILPSMTTIALVTLIVPPESVPGALPPTQLEPIDQYLVFSDLDVCAKAPNPINKQISNPQPRVMLPTLNSNITAEPVANKPWMSKWRGRMSRRERYEF
jgi:hypothetical protein